jgi:transposase
MSSQLLYQVFRVKSYRLTKLATEEHRVFLHVDTQQYRVCCSACRSRNVIRRGETICWFRNLPVGSELTWVSATLPRVQCRDSGLVRQIDSGLADPKRTYTHAFERCVLELSRYMTIQDIRPVASAIEFGHRAVSRKRQKMLILNYSPLLLY